MDILVYSYCRLRFYTAEKIAAYICRYYRYEDGRMCVFTAILRPDCCFYFFTFADKALYLSVDGVVIVFFQFVVFVCVVLV